MYLGGNNTRIEKILAIAVILLFISVSVIPSTGTTSIKQITMPTSSGNTLYVGGSGPGNYTRIQDAIDNASSGDTVYVYSGTYYERVKLNKAIDLIGENKETTVIDGERKDDVVYVSADYVTISGFTIQNSGKDVQEPDAGIKVHSDHNDIVENIIKKNHNGIYLKYCSYNKISGNNMNSNSDGIDIDDWTHHITILENNIIDNTCGISCGGFFENHHHIFSDNTINYNQEGIYLTGSSDNIISDNIIIGNYYQGIALSAYSSNNIITGNYISLNAWGIRVGFSNNIFISNNTLIRNYYGIKIGNRGDNKIIRNTIRDHISWGLHLYIWNTESDIDILQNNFLNNHPDATFLYGVDHLLDSFNVNWEGNYWNGTGLFLKPIFGIKEITILDEYYLPIIWINIDWHPAREPYDIGV